MGVRGRGDRASPRSGERPGPEHAFRRGAILPECLGARRGARKRAPVRRDRRTCAGPVRPSSFAGTASRRLVRWVPSTSPADAERLDLAGHSVMPGMVGLHNHLYYYQNTPRVAQMQYSGPRLYLGAGVTTVRTTGSMSPYQDISLKHSVERGEVPGPRIVITAPYVISPGTGRAAQGSGHVCDPGRGVRAPIRSLLGRGRARSGSRSTRRSRGRR